MRKYDRAVSDFVLWSRTNHASARSTQELDELLCDYIYYLYEEGMGRAKALDSIYGLVALFPAWRYSFPAALLSIRGWARLAPSVPYPPLTWDLSVLLACQLVKMGHDRLALGLLLSFDCLLRINELLGIRLEDVAVPCDPRLGVLGSVVRIRLKHTKTGKHQWVEVRSNFITDWLISAVRASEAQASLFPYIASVARGLFKQALLAVGMPLTYVPHSLRHGGATALHLAGISLEDILLRGRWASVKSARNYIQVGKALLLDMKVEPGVLMRARAAADHIRSFYPT